MKPLSEVAPLLFFIQIQIQAVWGKTFLVRILPEKQTEAEFFKNSVWNFAYKSSPQFRLIYIRMHSKVNRKCICGHPPRYLTVLTSRQISKCYQNSCHEDFAKSTWNGQNINHIYGSAWIFLDRPVRSGRSGS